MSPSCPKRATRLDAIRIVEWKVWGSLQNMAENGVDFAHFKYIHGTATMPESELTWGEWDRCGAVSRQDGHAQRRGRWRDHQRHRGPRPGLGAVYGHLRDAAGRSIIPVDYDHLQVRYRYTQPARRPKGQWQALPAR